MNKIIILFLFFLQTLSAFAMVADGMHTPKHYEEIPLQDELFQGACAIEDPVTHVHLSGVLIAPNIVATAAHGLTHLIPKNLKEAVFVLVKNKRLKIRFETPNGTQVYESDAVAIDTRYLETGDGREAKYDISFIRLSQPVQRIPIAKTPQKIIFSPQKLLTVITHGESDRFSFFPFWGQRARGFHLFETDIFFSSVRDPEMLSKRRSVLLSSIFFKPNEGMKPPQITDDEMTHRTFEATQNWLLHGKKPYALACSGTSGAPVFIKEDKKQMLFGIVTSTAPLEGHSLDLGRKETAFQNPKILHGRYQTIFALFYQQHPDSKTSLGEVTYTKDPFFDRMKEALLAY